MDTKSSIYPIMKNVKKGTESKDFNQGIAAVLSFFLPGVGQIYKGQIFRGIFYFFLIPGLYATVILWPLAAILHLLIIIGAYQPKED